MKNPDEITIHQHRDKETDLIAFTVDEDPQRERHFSFMDALVSVIRRLGWRPSKVNGRIDDNAKRS